MRIALAIVGLCLVASPAAAQGPSGGTSPLQLEEVGKRLRARTAEFYAFGPFGAQFLGKRCRVRQDILISRDVKSTLEFSAIITSAKRTNACTVETLREFIDTYRILDQQKRERICRGTAWFLDVWLRLTELEKTDWRVPAAAGPIPAPPEKMETADALGDYVDALAGWLRKAVTASRPDGRCPYSEKACSVLTSLSEIFGQYFVERQRYTKTEQDFLTVRRQVTELTQLPDCPPKKRKPVTTYPGGRKPIGPYQYVVVQDKDSRKMTARLWTPQNARFAEPGDLVEGRLGNYTILFPESGPTPVRGPARVGQPPIRTRTATTTVPVPEGQTVLLGGTPRFEVNAFLGWPFTHNDTDLDPFNQRLKRDGEFSGGGSVVFAAPLVDNIDWRVGLTALYVASVAKEIYNILFPGTLSVTGHYNATVLAATLGLGIRILDRWYASIDVGGGAGFTDLQINNAATGAAIVNSRATMAAWMVSAALTYAITNRIRFGPFLMLLGTGTMGAQVIGGPSFRMGGILTTMAGLALVASLH